MFCKILRALHIKTKLCHEKCWEKNIISQKNIKTLSSYPSESTDFIKIVIIVIIIALNNFIFNLRDFF